MKLTLTEVKTGYSAIKKLAISEYNKGNYEKSLSHIDDAATIASQIMWRYADDELEDLLSKIAEKAILNRIEIYKPKSKRVVFYDYFGSAVILTLQYIKALQSENYEILYLYEERKGRNTPVVDKLKDYSNVIIQKVEYKDDRLSRFQSIYNQIIAFQPSKVFVHINTLAACIPVLYCLPKEIVRYYINLGDHAFWLGSKGIDYSFEFRNFGATVSYQKRRLRKGQLLLLPYYPIADGNIFQGFPEVCKGKVVIFSGGDFYKMVDAQNTYWVLVKGILDQNPSCVILYANKSLNNEGQKFLNNFISTNNFEDRFIPIGFRPDINEVLKNSDIYLGTCPMSGGLMSQYAAVNAKPILQYYPEQLFAFEETESMICFNNSIQISFTDKQLLLTEARKLINDVEYRVRKGNELKSCMISENQFNTLFAKSINTNTSQIDLEDVEVKYDKLEQWWLEVNNEGYYDAGTYICSILGAKGYFYAPLLMLKYLQKKYVSKIISIYNKKKN